MITNVDISLLTAEVRDQVLAAYRRAISNEDHALTYAEAAWFYGYREQTIHSLVRRKELRAIGRRPNKRITHRAMRDYLQQRIKTGAPRKALATGQLSLH